MQTLFAPAKINLFLDILSRREDGFHDLHTAFLAVDLCDVLLIESRPAPALSIERIDIDGPYAGGIPNDGENILTKALCEFSKAFGSETVRETLSIRLTKNVPHGAGLGGGSSDAATLLRYLSRCAGGVDVSAVAARVGSDCPFFLGAGSAEATGRGEVLAPLPLRDLKILIAAPNFAVSTKQAYGALKPEMLGARSDVQNLRRWLENPAASMPRLENTFELALDSVYTALPEIRNAMLESGATIARLSGSGSASFGIFPDDRSRALARDRLSGVARCWECAPLSGA